MDKNNIKSLLSKTFVTEAKVPGLEVTNKAKSESDKVNKKAIKDMEKELSDYDKESKKETKDSTKPVKFNYNSDSEAEYHQEMEIMNGQEMIQYDRTPSETYKKRAEDAIAGAAYMGNSPDWANVVVPGQGGDPTFGKKLVKAIKASEKKRYDTTPTTKMYGDDWEVVQDHSHRPYAFENTKNNKSTIKETEKMKRLKFKKPFNGVNNALALIPESYKVDNKIFEMTDGNESYRLRWEGSLNEGKGVVLIASDSRMVNEDIQKMKHLMGYKSEETLGNLKASERLNENKSFNDVWKKTKTILTEGIEGGFHDGRKEIDVAEPIGKITKADFDELNARKNESVMPNLEGNEMAQIEAGYNAAMGSQGTEGSLYEMEQGEGPISVSDMRIQLLDTLKTQVPKMQPAEKEEFLNFVSLMGKYFAVGSGSQDTGIFRTLSTKLEELMDNQIQKMQSQAEPEMGLGESDRFNEVFGGMDEE